MSQTRYHAEVIEQGEIANEADPSQRNAYAIIGASPAFTPGNIFFQALVGRTKGTFTRIGLQQVDQAANRTYFYAEVNWPLAATEPTFAELAQRVGVVASHPERFAGFMDEHPFTALLED